MTTNETDPVIGRYQLLEHTADMGIEAAADSLPGLFAAAARGLREIVFGDRADGEKKEEFPIEVQGGDREELLVNWLNETLFLMHYRGVFPIDFHVEKLDDNRLRGKVSGTGESPGIEPVREVKAVTFHRLAIVRRNGEWQARIYVDL